MSEPRTADNLKEKGNEAFKKRDYETAIDFYTQSIALEPSAACYSNRSLAYIQLKKYSQAEVDATNAIHYDATFTKAWLRRGICRIQGKQYKKAYTDLLRADELNPNNRDIQKQLDVCVNADSSLKDLTVDSVVEEFVANVTSSLKEGVSNEAMSYADDIREYRPNNLPLMERVCDVFYEYGFFEEELSLLSGMMKEMESKDEEYCTLLLRCVKVNRARKHFKEALKQLELYNSLVKTSLKETALLDTLRREATDDSSVRDRAVAIVDTNLAIPDAPTSLYNMLYTLQTIRHNPNLVARYLLKIAPESFESLFADAGMDCEPYEVVIGNLDQIIQNNISHCYWAMDVMEAMSNNSGFELAKGLLSRETNERIRNMKQLILEQGKVTSQKVNEVFDHYLIWIVC